jgi:hypothetical protein
MPANSNDLRWLNPVNGLCMQLSGTDGSLSVFRGVTATNVGTEAAVRIRPSADNGPAEIYFSRRADGGGNAAGDNWIVGGDAFAAGDGHFGIGTGVRNVVMSIAPSGQTTFNYPVQATQLVARGGLIRSVPAANNGGCEIAFHRNQDQSGTAPGDVWSLGHAAHGAGPGNFAIGTSTRGSCLAINATGVVNLPYGLTIAGQPAAIKPWIGGWFFCNPLSVGSDNDGQKTLSVSRASTGRYTVSWTGAHPKGTQYMVIAVKNNLSGQLMWDRPSSTSLELISNNNGGFPQDPVEISVMIL